MGAMTHLRLLLLALLAPVCLAAPAALPPEAECLIPSKPGGAMDLTCKLAQQALHADSAAPQLTLSYLPGGVGAVAWHTMV